MRPSCVVSVLPAIDNNQLALCPEKQCSTAAGNRAKYCCKRYQQQRVFSQQQDHPPKVHLSLYVYAALLKLLALHTAVRQPFIFGTIPSAAQRLYSCAQPGPCLAWLKLS